ncbi:hypothetical protein [Rubritalea tangerina]|uniref:hypothetical protein n=1 Tax=Rubritalea tangerina TaxID=430798 RepID=UPI003612A0F2
MMQPPRPLTFSNLGMTGTILSDPVNKLGLLLIVNFSSTLGFDSPSFRLPFFKAELNARLSFERKLGVKWRTFSLHV